MNEKELKNSLKAISKEKGIHFNASWKQLLLERFLARLATSSYSNKFIFKGGFLLAYLIKIGRETTDLDFLVTRMKADKNGLQMAVEEIAAIRLQDGFVYSFASIEKLSQPHMNYTGYRITLNASFLKIKDRIHLDIGIGDVVDPKNQEIKLFHYQDNPFFENSISLLVYPLESIFAEKLEIILSKGSANTRMKDYHDLILLLRNDRSLHRSNLKEAISKTFANRGTHLTSLQVNQSGLKKLQQLWSAHLRNLGNIAEDLDLPKEIAFIIGEINKLIPTIQE